MTSDRAPAEAVPRPVVGEPRVNVLWEAAKDGFCQSFRDFFAPVRWLRKFWGRR